MSAVIVSVEAGANNRTAYARQGGREHQATSTSPELAVRLAAAELLGHEVHTVRVECKAAGVWAASGRVSS